MRFSRHLDLQYREEHEDLQMPSDNAQPPVKLSLPLEYQKDLFTETRAEDELVLLARGLGLLRLVTNLLHSYDAAGNNLIVVVGADERENGWIGEALAEHAAVSRSPLARGLSQVNTDMMSVGTREKMYSQGGIFSITSRILIVDLLSSLLKPETVTGLIVLHAERIVATSTEAFIIRIYRQLNKVGFLKAFSDDPQPFTTGFAPLATMMRNLFLRKPSLWPRFHVTVAKSLEGRKKAEVIELEVPMTDAMRDIQNAVLECVEVSIGELKKSGTGLELDDWTLDSALHKSFDVIVRRQLDPMWHRVSYRTRQIVNDLTVLRSILHALLTYDAVSFNRYLDTILAAHQPPPGSTRQNQSPWLFLDAANTIFETAKRRVYTGKANEIEALETSNALPDTLRPVLEEQPKWAILAEVLEEIERDVYFNPAVRDDSNGTTLIMCSDQETCRQLREYLQNMHVRPEQPNGNNGGDDAVDSEPKPSAGFMMRRKLRNYLKWKKDFARVSASLFAENQKALTGFTDQKGANGQRGKAPPNKRRRVRGGSAAAAGGGRPVNSSLQFAADKESQVASLLAEIRPTDADSLQKEEIAVDDLGEMEEDYFELYEMNDLVVVHPYDGDMDEHVLEEVKPRYVVMYEPDAAFIRRVEVYRSSHNDRNVRVYFMYYGGSVEEQRYLSAVRREKDAFTRLIREKGNMSVTLTLDGKGPDDPQEQFLRTVNTRIAGGGRLAATAEPPGSSSTSFKNGRLFHQAETMLHHYKHPMLLIEFDHPSSFTLDPFADLHHPSLASAAHPADLQSKLVLLTLAFPRLKIIWSSSPHQTADIFHELKKINDEPDPVKAVQIGLVAGEDPADQSFNQAPAEMLRAVPGVTAKNLQRITLEVRNLMAVANLGADELGGLVGREAGRQVWRFFNRSVFEE
ncbi:MAG: DNA repair [Lasallia pustulata]|uniref:DNA repair n=1 Tax=Lasallia pustulata TaxID=136370 RepID=A0A5M8PZU6_9LECA|nr:MAG: DNA repair [Lasallia pustulata]